MYTAFTVMGGVYAKIFWVTDERMNGNGGAGRVMQGKPRDARYAKHEWARVGCRAYAAPSKR